MTEHTQECIEYNYRYEWGSTKGICICDEALKDD